MNMKVTAFVATLAFSTVSTTVRAAAPENKITVTTPAPTELPTHLLADSTTVRAQLNEKLEKGEFNVELAKLGVTAQETQARLAAMTDVELQQVIDGTQRQAGGEVIVISVGVVLLVALVLLIVLLLRPASGGGGTTIVH
jgi:hypothetical protein